MTTVPAGKWVVDTTHSEIGFSIKHLMISKVKGKFNSFTGEIITGEHLADTKISGSIDVKSIDTNQQDRDHHLRTGDFFDAEEFPTIDFVSTKVTHRTGDNFDLEGNITIHGVTKTIVLNAELGGVAVDGYGQTKLAGSATGVINREEFGLTYNSALEAGGVLLGENVQLTLEIQATLSA